MKLTSFIIPVVILASMSSCGTPGTDESYGETQTAPVFDQTNNQQEQSTDLQLLPADSVQLPVQQPIQGNSQPVANGKLNPAHGAPGHRCDLPVGAPLDGKPAANINPGQTVPNSVIPSKSNNNVSLPTNKVASGMNPEHGQPGHRCDIAVGAPLNSPLPSSSAALPVQAIPDTSKN